MLIAGAGFELSRVPIPRCLAPFVDSWIGYRETSVAAVERVEHPTGRTVLIFEFGERIELVQQPSPCRGAPHDTERTRFKTGFFAGIDESPTLTRFSGEQAGIEVNLSPAGAFALSRGAMTELRGLAVESTELGLSADLCSRLFGARSWEERFRLVGDELSRRVRGARVLSPLVRNAMALIDAEGGAVRIDQLSLHLGASRKYVHELFSAQTGFAPKRYAALRRFARVRELLSAGRHGSLASVASQAGYADQAHMARAVRQFAGVTPRELAREVQAPLFLEAQLLKHGGDGSSLDPE